MPRILFVLALGIFLSFFSVFGAAVATPDSGAILNQQERQEINRTLRSISESGAIKTETELEMSGQASVYVKKIEFNGYGTIAVLQELNSIAEPYLNKTLKFSELKKIAVLVTRYLREEKGHLLSRAYIPAQDVTSGTVFINIMLTSLDGPVSVKLTSDARIKSHIIDKIASGALKGDQAIHLKDLERSVLLINDLPGISARAYLDKGTLPGTSRITIEAQEGGTVSALVFADNFGNRYTGTFRRAAQVVFSDSMGWGDLFSITYLNADDLNHGKVNFSVPVGHYGTFWNTSYSGLHYELGGKLKDLKAAGNAYTIATDLQHPVKRTKKTSIWGGLGYKQLLLEDKLNSAVTSDRAVSVSDISLTCNFFDDFWGGGLASFGVNLNPGYLDMTDGKSSDDTGARTDGHFFKAVYTAARLQKATDKISLFFSARGQFADSNLDSSQKIILGGPTGVRAYPIGEASGDEGHIMTFEKRYDLSFMPSWLRTQIVAFYDAGYIRLHKNTWTNAVTNMTGKNHYWLQGAGIGLNFEKKGAYRIQLSYAHKTDSNDGKDSLENNADNRSDGGQFWAQAICWF